MALNENRDAEGLQAVEQNDYPEVVSGQDLRPGSTRRSSMTSPEHYSTHPQQYQPVPQQDEKSNAYGGVTPGTHYFAGQQSMNSSSPPQYDHSSNKGLEGQEKPRERRMCGMRRKVFLWVASIIAAIVVLAVVLGAALGATLGKSDHQSSNSNSRNSSSSSSSRFQAKDKTGMALLSPSGSNTVYAYYIDSSGAIVETTYANGAWSANNTQLPTTNNVTTLSSGSTSPIAAISYTLSGNTAYRQIFWLDSQGLVATSNTTGSGNWSIPYNPVSNISALPNSIALSAVAGTDSTGLNGIRVYFGSSNNVIQEIGCDFKESLPLPVWHIWNPFVGSDAASGVGSAIVSNTNHLYLRNSSTTRVQQWTWDYVNVSTWKLGANSTADAGVAEGGSIAATTDGQNTDYIFYHRAGDKQTVEALYTGSGASIQAPSTTVGTIKIAPVGYALAATYSNAAIVINQNSSSAQDLLFSSVGRNGQSSGYSTDTGRS